MNDPVTIVVTGASKGLGAAIADAAAANRAQVVLADCSKHALEGHAREILRSGGSGWTFGGLCRRTTRYKGGYNAND